MKKENSPRFHYLLLLIRGLLYIPYSNVPIERSFSQLKLIKNNKRLRLKTINLSSFMILKNLTKTTKVKDFDRIIKPAYLKQVKMTIGALSAR